VDLDGCRQNGKEERWASEIITELDSYTELSPSGRGVHVIVKGELPDGSRQKDMGGDHHGVGLYDATHGRYLTMTGTSLNGSVIHERAAELLRLHARLFPAKAKTRPQCRKPPPGTDDDLIERARKANDGGKFARLWDGQWKGHYASQSEADLALCTKLAFWTNNDPARIDALFRRSGLMREKWERADYRNITIAKAMNQTCEAWKPRESLILAADAVDANIELLNAMVLFHGKLRFESVARRGSMILATTDQGKKIVFPTMTDLTSFAKARTAIADGADVLLTQPANNRVHDIWDPAASMIIRLAAQDAIRVDHVWKAECKDLLDLMWRHEKQPSAKDSRQFMDFMIAIRQAVRNRDQPTPPCVFIAEGHTWVHMPTFRNWLSKPTLTNRLYPLGDIRQGLLLLGFEYLKKVTRGADGDSAGLALWRGPVDVLLE
jgi:hypothetical protein